MTSESRQGERIVCCCSLRTTLCVRFKSETVACGLIFMAARRLKVCHRCIPALPTSFKYSHKTMWLGITVVWRDECGIFCAHVMYAIAQVALPVQPPWWQLFGVRYEDICEVCCEMQALYVQAKAQFIDVRPQAELQVCHLPTLQAFARTWCTCIKLEEPFFE